MVIEELILHAYFRPTLKNKTVMKRLVIAAFAFMLSATTIFAQKAGKAETPKPQEFYSCPKHNQVTSHDRGKCSICGTELSLSQKESRAANIIKNYTCPAHIEVVAHDPGKCPKCGRKLNLSAKEELKPKVAKIYTCPMHREVALDKDGVCTKCGKALVEKGE